MSKTSEAKIDRSMTDLLLSHLNRIPTATVSRREINDAAADAGLPFPRFMTKKAGSPRGRWENFTPERAKALGIGYVMSARGRRGAIAVHSSKGAARVARAASAPATPRTITLPTPVPAAPAAVMSVPAAPTPVANAVIETAVTKALGADLLLAPSEHAPFVPAKLPGYMPFGHYETISKIMEAKTFLPIMIVGPSGNGKTEMVEQVAAALGSEYVRCNVTSQTDEDDLIGGFRLINGDMKFALGPVPMAMLTGASLLLDEIDLGGSALMCLQPVLEGKPLFIKKIGRYINPAPGFNVFATANTKGRGDDGKYAHTTIMNEAMLERFALLFDQGWAPEDIERKILNHILRANGKADATLARHLVQFANTTRTQYAAQGCNDQIATRRLVHIVRSYCTTGDLALVMKLSLARFDDATSEAFLNLWNAIHGTADAASPSGAPIPAATNVPF